MKETIDIYNIIYKYRNTDYIRDLFSVFKKDMKYDNNQSLEALIDKFTSWIRIYRSIGTEFIKKMNDEFIVFPKRILELEKGILDSDSKNLINSGCNVTIVSPYSDTFPNNISKENGSLVYGAGEGLIIAKEEMKPLSSIEKGMLVTSLSNNKSIGFDMIKCANDGYHSLIMAYGDSGYNNYEDRINELKKLKEIAEKDFNLNVDEFESNFNKQYGNAIYVRQLKK